MKRLGFLVLLPLLLLSAVNCHPKRDVALRLGAERCEVWQPLLTGKKVGVLVNHTSRVQEQHLVDVLLARDIDVCKIFAPEHGFRGKNDAGAIVTDEIDPRTGIAIKSLYNKNRKPSDEDVKDLDVVVFDIQDVGVRFFTYISSMHYMMEACARNNVLFVVLDRPNPNGDYVDGPVLKSGFRSFVGMHPIPVVHGLTVGELAKMINGEGWLQGEQKCDLRVIEMEGYSHCLKYPLPVKPSPNLPNYLAVRLYPSLCLFEATTMSIGRGTNFPFQVVGGPEPHYGVFIFIPRSIKGMDSNPKYQDQTCYGEDFRMEDAEDHRFSLAPLIRFYEKSGREQSFFSRPEWFHLLIGNDLVLEQIKNGMTETEIKASWTEELAQYKQLRQHYLLYP
jgi:uncharacterized protein YbbC (DUF1343 family)